MLNKWKKSFAGQWSSVREEWTTERKRFASAREEWESKVKMSRPTSVPLLRNLMLGW
jgi:hypothetical protein